MSYALSKMTSIKSQQLSRRNHFRDSNRSQQNHFNHVTRMTSCQLARCSMREYNMAVIRQYCEKCFVQFVGLRCQTERTSASSMEKVCYYSRKSVIFFPGKWSNHEQRYIKQQNVQPIMNCFVRIHHMVLKAQRVHQILRLNWKQASVKTRF